MSRRVYTKSGRLADVLALIQVLSLDEYTHRSESGLSGELPAPPSSANSWTDLAREHPEFFRIANDQKNPVSLVARHVLPRNAAGKIDLPLDFVQLLIKTAIELHDRQVKDAERWTFL